MGTQKRKKKKQQRQKEEIFFLTVGLGVSCSTAGLGGILWGVSLSNRRLGGLVSSHFFVNLLQVELLQVQPRRVLYEIPL